MTSYTTVLSCRLGREVQSSRFLHPYKVVCMRPMMLPLFLSVLLVLGPASAAKPVPPLDPDADHVTRWNWFADALYALHEKQLAAHRIKTVEHIDGYYRDPEFYHETRYIDAVSGRLLSVVQRERAEPENIHSIEIYVHDKQGRVIRDYSVLFLPHSRSAPQHTLINLHSYHGELHAFRQFDATDNRLYEFCQGRYQGKAVEIRLDEFDVIELQGRHGTIFDTPAYRACFQGLPVESAGNYLTPQ